MGTRRSLIDERRAEIADLVRRHRGRSIAIFGSVARGEDDAGSDIDFLVDFEPGSSLFDLRCLRHLDEATSVRTSAGGITRPRLQAPTMGSGQTMRRCGQTKRSDEAVTTFFTKSRGAPERVEAACARAAEVEVSNTRPDRPLLERAADAPQPGLRPVQQWSRWVTFAHLDE